MVFLSIPLTNGQFLREWGPFVVFNSANMSETLLSDMIDARLEREITRGLGPLGNELMERFGQSYRDARFLLDRKGREPQQAIAEAWRDEIDCVGAFPEHLGLSGNDVEVAAADVFRTIEQMRARLWDHFYTQIAQATAERIVEPNEDLVRFEVQEIEDGFQVGILTFNNTEQANAMNEEMALVFRRRLDEIKEADVDALIITGEGDVFSAGGDFDMIEEKQGNSVELNRLTIYQFYRSFLDMLDLDIPIIAAMNGPATGAGLGLACACDHRIAAKKEGPFAAFTFAKLGIRPGMGSSVFGERVTSGDTVSDMLYFGDFIDQGEAWLCGLVEDIVDDPDELMNTVLREVHGMLGESGYVGKMLEARLRGPALHEKLMQEARDQAASFHGEDHQKWLSKERFKRSVQVELGNVDVEDLRRMPRFVLEHMGDHRFRVHVADVGSHDAVVRQHGLDPSNIWGGGQTQIPPTQEPPQLVVYDYSGDFGAVPPFVARKIGKVLVAAIEETYPGTGLKVTTNVNSGLAKTERWGDRKNWE